MSEQPDVKVGQVWESTDKRDGGKRVVVVGFTWGNRYSPQTGAPTHARIRTVVQGTQKGRHTAVRLNRFRPNSTGYRLVSQPEGDT